MSTSRIDAARVVRACVTEGVTERPPIAGFTYHAFVVHPAEPGLIYALAIGHDDRAINKIVVDVVRQNISVEDSSALLKCYGITNVVAGLDEGEGDSLAHAVAGIALLVRESRA